MTFGEGKEAALSFRWHRRDSAGKGAGEPLHFPYVMYYHILTLRRLSLHATRTDVATSFFRVISGFPPLLFHFPSADAGPRHALCVCVCVLKARFVFHLCTFIVLLCLNFIVFNGT